MKAKIGVVGCGFVGAAVAHGFKDQDVIQIDPKFGNSTKDLLNVGKLDAVFICVPTPMGESGRINSFIVEQVMLELKVLDTILVLKSTVTPDIIGRISTEYENFVYNPEFLREATALYDFEYPSHHVYGGKPEITKKLEQIYKDYSICKYAPVFHTTAAEASFVKYGINCFLATKVLFWNQFAEQCEKLGVDYNNVKDAIQGDPRIGSSHVAVPGSDGKRGFGGACFTKDTAAFNRLSIDFDLLREAILSNNVIRAKYELCDREKEQNVTYQVA